MSGYIAQSLRLQVEVLNVCNSLPLNEHVERALTLLLCNYSTVDAITVWFHCLIIGMTHLSLDSSGCEALMPPQSCIREDSIRTIMHKIVINKMIII